MFHRRFCSLLIGASILFAAPQPAYALRINYAIDLNAEHNSNVLLTRDDPIALAIAGSGIGFGITHDTSTLQARISGRAEYRNYNNSRFGSTIDTMLTGRVNWFAIPDRLSFSIVDSLGLQPINRLGPDVPDNRQQVNTISAGPLLRFNLGASWHGATELRYVRSEAEIADQFNSNRVDLAIRATKPLSATSNLLFDAQTQQVDFDNNTTARDYTRTEVFARYSRKRSRLTFLIDLGHSRLDYWRDRPGLINRRTDPLFRTELTWQPNTNNRLYARMYSQFTDAPTDSLANIGEGTELPLAIVPGDMVVNASPFLQRQLKTEYTFTTARWTLAMSPYFDRRRYEDDSTFDQNDYGTDIEASWRGRHNLEFGLTGSLNHTDYVNLDRQDINRHYSGFIRYESTKRWISTISFAHYERDSTTADQNVSQNNIGLAIRYRNR